MNLALIIIAAIIMLPLLGYAYYGGFKKISFKIEEQGGEMLAYENVTGPYRQTPTVMNRVYYALLNEDKVETTKGFGIYYDNPKKVEKSQLRSEVGCIIENLDGETITTLSQKYQIKTLPKATCVVAEFPIKGKLSAIVGIMKVYPALNKYTQQQGISGGYIIEIYNVPNKTIHYRQQVVT